MKRVFKKQVLSETDIVLIFRNELSTNVCCDVCGNNSMMLQPHQLSRSLHISSREFYRWIENGDVHWIEDKNLNMFLCAGSLVGMLRDLEWDVSIQKIKALGSDREEITKRLLK